jgi:2-polyprenyl-3-methyl-5-hydroxy-6-metoxy-1,4-benzoquinol methylase
MTHSAPPNLDVFMNYEYEIDLNGPSAGAAVIRFVKPESRVLEIGAGSGAIARHIVAKNRCQVTALESNPTSVEKLEKFCHKVYALDLNATDWAGKLENKADGYDYVIAADVLEHVYDPWRVLRNMKSLLNKNGSVILSLPHASHSSVLTSFYGGDVEYREWGLLDKTHIRFFGLHNIEALYEHAGLAITQVHFVILKPEDTEFAEHWKRLPKEVRAAFSKRPYANVYQVVTEAKPAEMVANKISLLDRIEELQPKSGGLFGFFRS